jgi:hypothetical protein
MHEKSVASQPGQRDIRNESHDRGGTTKKSNFQETDVKNLLRETGNLERLRKTELLINPPYYWYRVVFRREKRDS